MSDTEWDFIRDKMAEEKEARDWANYDYCHKECPDHSLDNPCDYCDVEEESWDYKQCYKDGWMYGD